MDGYDQWKTSAPEMDPREEVYFEEATEMSIPELMKSLERGLSPTAYESVLVNLYYKDGDMRLDDEEGV